MSAAVGRLAAQAGGVCENRGGVLHRPVLAAGLSLADLCRAGHLLQCLGDQLPGLFTHHRRLENWLRLDENLEQNEAGLLYQQTDQLVLPRLVLIMLNTEKLRLDGMA